MAEADCFRILQEVVPKDHFIHRHCLNERMENVQAMLDVSLDSKLFISDIQKYLYLKYMIDEYF